MKNNTTNKMENNNTTEEVKVKNSINIKVIKSNRKKFDYMLNDQMLAGLILLYFQEMMEHHETVERMDQFFTEHRNYSDYGISYGEMLLMLCECRKHANMRQHSIQEFVALRKEYDRREIVCKATEYENYILNLDVSEVGLA